ncbi:MAG TPA: ABC transporter permease, partial [Stellaceae bacterium]|nr:ABC transporter permease [Stellaceae bacterium]
AESLAWTIFFALSPISCVYYPVTTLPGWLQPVAWSLPQTYVFEGMRAVLFQHAFRADYLAAAVLLDTLYLAIGIALFAIYFRDARRRGTLMQMGE